MPAKTLPGLGIKAFAPLGEHEWNVWMDENMLMLSLGIAQLTVRSRTQALSASESAGAQIAPTGHAQAGKVSVYYDGAWSHYSPQEGWTAWVKDTDQRVVFNGGVWREIAGLNQHHVHAAVISASTNVPEIALRRGSVIVVDSPEPVTLTIVETPAGAEVPDGASFARQVTTVIQRGVGQVVIANGAGIILHSADTARKTRVQWSCLSIIPISATEYVLAGDLVP